MITKEAKENFLKELEQLYRKHNISISHEDEHGAFILEEFTDHNLEWMKYCQPTDYYYSKKDELDEESF